MLTTITLLNLSLGFGNFLYIWWLKVPTLACWRSLGNAFSFEVSSSSLERSSELKGPFSKCKLYFCKVNKKVLAVFNDPKEHDIQTAEPIVSPRSNHYRHPAPSANVSPVVQSPCGKIRGWGDAKQSVRAWRKSTFLMKDLPRR
ncbi:hypothetical protein TNCV_331001 [Trichonephila clavipes]|nr:hypothetical protein TNCV_331001 [Trichonephila clavipes]